MAEDGATGFDRRWEVLEGGFATPSRFGPGVLSGCLHRADGTRVALSERFGGHQGDHYRTENPARLDPPTGALRLDGRGVYLGHLMSGHYGHFITETLSTFWIFDALPAEGFDYFLFHDFKTRWPLPDYALRCLGAFGIAPERILRVGDAPLAFDRLTVPERLLRLNQSADPALRPVHRRIAGHVAGPDAAGPADRRLYLSRRGVDARALGRGYANEVRIEAVFRRAGFEVVRPETLPFAAQMRLYAHARILAGPAGSGLHNVLFAPDDALVIEIADPRHRNQPGATQALCTHVAGARGAFMPFRGRVLKTPVRLFHPRQGLLFDPVRADAALREILAREGEPAAGEAGPPPPPTLRERAEIALNCLRVARANLRRARAALSP